MANAAAAAAQYLSVEPFSRAGLIQQLSSSAGDGYSLADATYGVDSQNADWNAQAALAAKAYLAVEPFSRAGLIEQLSSSAGDGFTHAQAVYGATAAGL
ncbi:MAG TPA: Ltp family lipoprotein [Acidimicrobiales bacterium]|nr:Ltp family lipoprotein [Acidimicrobiales bacterium]